MSETDWKTFAIRELGKSYKSFIEVNFIKTPEAINLFKNVYSAEEILLRLSAFTDHPLIKGDTLIFFDEVQCCEDIVTNIKSDGHIKYAPIYMTMFIAPAVLDSGKYIMDLSGLQWHSFLHFSQYAHLIYNEASEVLWERL